MANTRNRRQQRTDRNRKRLLSAAMKVFSQKGYHKATLDEICKRANLGKGTVYQYFGSKKDLFLGIVDSRLNELGRCIADAVGGIEDDLKRLHVATSAYMEFHSAHRSFYRLLVHEQSSFAKEIRERLHRKFFSHLRILEQVFRTGMNKGKLKKMDPGSAAFALVGMCNSLIFRWLMSEKPYPLTMDLPMVLEIFLRGIARQTTKGGV